MISRKDIQQLKKCKTYEQFIKEYKEWKKAKTDVNKEEKNKYINQA